MKCPRCKVAALKLRAVTEQKRLIRREAEDMEGTQWFLCDREEEPSRNTLSLFLSDTHNIITCTCANLAPQDLPEFLVLDYECSSPTSTPSAGSTRPEPAAPQ